MGRAREGAEPAGAVEVLVLTQERCDQCDRAGELLARLCDEYPLRVRTLALDSSEGRQLAASGGILFAPGIFVGGAAFSYGRLSERKLRRELERRLVRA